MSDEWSNPSSSTSKRRDSYSADDGPSNNVIARAGFEIPTDEELARADYARATRARHDLARLTYSPVDDEALGLLTRMGKDSSIVASMPPEVRDVVFKPIVTFSLVDPEVWVYKPGDDVATYALTARVENPSQALVLAVWDDDGKSAVAAHQASRNLESILSPLRRAKRKEELKDKRRATRANLALRLRLHLWVPAAWLLLGFILSMSLVALSVIIGQDWLGFIGAVLIVPFVFLAYRSIYA